MDISDHAQHSVPVVGCFRCRVGTLPSVPKDAMEVNFSFRMPKKLHEDVMDKANGERRNVSDILRAALEEYAYGDDQEKRRA